MRYLARLQKNYPVKPQCTNVVFCGDSQSRPGIGATLESVMTRRFSPKTCGGGAQHLNLTLPLSQLI